MTKTLRVLPHMCALQRKSIEDLLAAADDIGAAATSVVSSGGQGYSQLFHARDDFKALLMSVMQHTRMCIEEDIPEESSI